MARETLGKISKYKSILGDLDLRLCMQMSQPFILIVKGAQSGQQYRIVGTVAKWKRHALPENQENVLSYKNIDIEIPSLLILTSTFLKLF